MKKRSVILSTIFIACLILVFCLPFIYWNQMESIPLDVWIIDKTPTNQEFSEHKGLMWALNSKKVILEKTRQSLRYDTDYYGEVPQEEAQVEKPDLIYLADSEGGISEEEISSIKDKVGGNNTIVGEFDIAGSNKGRGLEEVFRVSWTGWKGKHFANLKKNIEVPNAIIDNYEKQSQEKWNFKGEGYVIVSDDNQVIVMENKKDIGKKALSFSYKQEYQDEFTVSNSIPYEQWFELVKPDASAEQLANFTFDVTDIGKKKLDEFGIPTTFPAIIRSKNTQFTSYYFAGDFAQMDFSGKYWNYYGYSKVKSFLSFGKTNNGTKFYYECYVPMMHQLIQNIKGSSDLTEKKDTSTTQYTARTSKAQFQIMKNGQWEEFFVKGVNLGSTVPGKWFTEFSYQEELYLEWFELIARMNANSIRIYTLLPPQFYSALVDFNEKNPKTSLWLYQEIWPEEYPEDENYLKEEYNTAYQDEIERVIDAMHGQIYIPKRQGRAYGLYSADVSPYILGYLVGRELEPQEVISTNIKNKEFTFDGEYLFLESDASPTEAWLAMSCDYVLCYEEKKYQWQHPVGIVSWPTLDKKEHDSEWNAQGDKSLEYNDKISVDINNILVKENLQTGLFGAYHIYPNYPDFMNNEPSYAKYKDEDGSFRYGGYLKEFIEGHTKYAALVAEFGLATGMGNAHENPDGYHQGGITEASQGEGIVRMMKVMKKEGYAGGLIFEWADEWAKKTWTTEPYIIPFERNPLWHNAVDPEQNYGLYAMESDLKKFKSNPLEGTKSIRQMTIWADATYLHVELELKKEPDFSKEKLIIGLDTYDRSKGEFKYGADILVNAMTGMEYIIEINSKSKAQLLVHPGYNSTNEKYASYSSTEGLFERISFLTNKERITVDGTKIDAVYQDLSTLKYGSLVDNSYYHWNVDGKKVFIRIPWTRINVTDPSEMRVVDDPLSIKVPQRDELQTIVTEGILASGILINIQNKEVMGMVGVSNREAFTWENWDVPTYKTRLKQSYSIISDYFKELDSKK